MRSVADQDEYRPWARLALLGHNPKTKEAAQLQPRFRMGDDIVDVSKECGHDIGSHLRVAVSVDGPKRRQVEMLFAADESVVQETIKVPRRIEGSAGGVRQVPLLASIGISELHTMGHRDIVPFDVGERMDVPPFVRPWKVEAAE